MRGLVRYWWGEATLTRRRMVFFYDLLMLMALFVVAFVFHSVPEINKGFKLADGVYVFEKYRLFINSIWFGALGGVIISLKGVYDNSGDPTWSNRYNLWHIGRPFSGGATGLIAALIFTAISNTPPSRPVIYMIAFLLGTQEARFFNFLYELARLFVQVPQQLKPPGLRISGIEPGAGKTGTQILITGQALDRDAVIKLGGVKLEGSIIASDGTSATGTVPDLGNEDMKVDITVVNPTGGTSAVLPDRFDYEKT